MIDALVLALAIGAATPEDVVMKFAAAYVRQKETVGQQPAGSTDKPPLIDCCILSGIPDGPPNRFTLGESVTLPDD